MPVTDGARRPRRKDILSPEYSRCEGALRHQAAVVGKPRPAARYRKTGGVVGNEPVEIETVVQADVWKKYKSKIDNPYFDFIYEKRFGKKINNKQTNNKSENSWDNGNSKVEKLNNLIAAFKGSDKNKLKIEGINYNNSKYKDTNLFVKEKTKCASRKNKVTDADGNGVETYDEPPVNEDKELAGQNTTIAIPPTAPSPGSIKVDSPPDDSIDNIPHDAAQLVI